MRTKPSFHFKIKWKLKNKFLPFFSRVTDIVDIYKVKDRILIRMNKMRSKGLSFKKHPTCIELKTNGKFYKMDYKNLINYMG